MALLVAGQTSLLFAQDVELNPGFIAGTVQVGTTSETNINRVDIFATAAGGLSSQAFITPSPPSPSTPYTITVDVPAGTSPTYNVQVTIWMDNFRDKLTFPSQQVVVNEGATTSGVDFIVANPGFIEGTITVLGGGTLGDARIFATQPSSAPFIFAQTSTSGSLGGNFRFPVPPNAGIRCGGDATLTTGFSAPLPDQFVDVEPGGTARCDYTVETPSVGSIAGTINFSGPNSVIRYDVRANGPTFKGESLSPPFTGPENLENYALNNLAPGNYQLFLTMAFLNNFDDQFRFPNPAFSPTFNPAVSAGTTTEVNISACQAFINGNINLSGSASLSDINSALIRVTGASSTNAQNGSAQDRVNLTDGSIDLIVSEGGWFRDTAVLNFFRAVSDPKGFLNQSLVFVDNQAFSNPINVLCGETAIRDLNLAMGSVTINFTVSGGGIFSNPRLDGFCQLRDGSNVLLNSYNFTSVSSGQNNVTLGSVTFVGPQGSCDITARATVGGSLTTFSQVSVGVVPGVSQEIDIGGPSLSITFPEADLCLDADQITVTGVTSDDVEVVSVTVNGVLATLTSTNNASDPNEVTFEATIPLLVKGSNQIVTISTDTSGKTATDTRTMFNDEGPPALSWTPADGTVTGAFNILIEGTATDDAGIDSITVKGTPVGFSSTGNPNNEVSFSLNVPLSLGANFIEVVATDISMKKTVQVHEITVAENQPPVANAGGPYNVSEGSAIQLNAGASSDPDGDVLTFEWDFDYDGVTFDVDGSGVAPILNAAGLDGPLTRTVAVRVSDASLATIATARLDMQNVAPVVSAITAPIDPVQVNTTVGVSASFTDDGTPDTHTVLWAWGDATSDPGTVTQGSGSGSVADSHTYSTPGVYTVKLTVTDDDGGAGSSEFRFVVVYDPDGGFVTGGGWIDSPLGAYTAEPSLIGKANFGFVSKYKKGATIPTGVTEFQFKVADLNFHSNTYEWLVVAGPRAQYKGTGTINGGGNYGFMLTAIDGAIPGGGGIDRFRIKIWDKNSGDIIVYDNKLGADDTGNDATALGGGNIVIHTK